MKAFNLQQTYIHLSDGPEVQEIEVTPDFWDKIDQRTDLTRGRLLATFYQNEDGTNWEMHPEGEEVIILLAGACDLKLETPAGEQIVVLQKGEAFIIPRGYWHIFQVKEPAEILSITRGAGTQSRPV